MGFFITKPRNPGEIEKNRSGWKKTPQGALNLIERIVTLSGHFTQKWKRPQVEQLSKTNHQMYSGFTNKNKRAVDYMMRK